MLGSLIMMYPMDEEFLNMLIKISMKEIFTKGRKKEEEITISVKELYSKENGKTILKLKEN